MKTEQKQRVSLESLPGSDLIKQGFLDLKAGRESIPSLLVEICSPELGRNGWPVVPGHVEEMEPERRLYQRLREDGEGNAYSRYNAYLRTLTSFGRALEHRRMSRPHS